MATQAAEGFLLLTIPNVKVSAPFLTPPEQIGLLALECVTVPLSQTDTNATNPWASSPGSGQSQRDVWLVLRLNNFELPLSATDAIYHSRSNFTFTFKAREGPVLVSIPPPSNAAAEEDLESFEVLLSQYGVLQETDSYPKGHDPDMKGRLVLVDEDDGNVVGTLGEQYSIREDPNVAQNDKTPVMIEMPEEGQRELFVQSINPDDQDMILKTASYVSRGILFATDMIGKGMGMATEYYVKNTVPNPQPMVFSESTKKNIRRVHGISGQAVKVSARTTGLIHSLIDRTIDRANVPKTAYQASGPTQAQYAPSLPSRGEKRASGTFVGGSGRGSPTPGGAPALPARKPRLLNRLLMSTDLLLSTIETSAQSLVAHTTNSAATGLGHKYGPEMGNAVRMMGDSVKNVGVVYIDYRGVGRRALIRKAGKRVIRGRMGNREVVFGGDQEEGGPIGLSDERTHPDGGSPKGKGRMGSHSNAPSLAPSYRKEKLN